MNERYTKSQDFIISKILENTYIPTGNAKETRGQEEMAEPYEPGTGDDRSEKAFLQNLDQMISSQGSTKSPTSSGCN
jgi:hypothetical protein